jgi:hypothetical protein
MYPRSTSSMIRIATAFALAALAAGCEGTIEDAQVPPSTHEQPGAIFTDEQALLDWLAEKAATVPLASAQVHRDGTGRVLSVDYSSPEDRATLAGLLGGTARYFLIGGERQSVDFLAPRKTPDADALGAAPANGEVAAIAQGLRTGGLSSSKSLCSGSFCTSNSSTNDHFGFSRFSYHSVGAGTSQTSGGWKETVYPMFPDPTWSCRTRCNGGAPYICRPGDFQRNDNRNGVVCVHQTGQNNLGVDVVWFSDGFTVYTGSRTVRNAASVGMERSSIGVLSGPCQIPFPSPHTAECQINGVCAAHSAFGTGGSTMAITGAGSYACPFN